MTDHDPRAADVLADAAWASDHWVWIKEAHAVLDRLAAAGLVVRPADEYEQVEWHWADDCCNRPVLDGDWPDNPDHRPLYVRKENPAVAALLAAERASTEEDR